MKTKTKKRKKTRSHLDVPPPLARWQRVKRKNARKMFEYAISLIKKMDMTPIVGVIPDWQRDEALKSMKRLRQQDIALAIHEVRMQLYTVMSLSDAQLGKYVLKIMHLVLRRTKKIKSKRKSSR